jgi:UDP-N-acetylglucosamine--N-acetylmuramyl-(pentapeptide) pyrophosphoryl-undecaprenol N-acetylglucosamine transferase
VLFAAGGTGGHVFPAVAVADALVAASNRNALPDDREVHVSFAGTAGRQEARLVPAAGYELHVVPAVSLARPLSSPANVVKNLFALPFRLAWCLWKAFALLAKLRPHVVVGTGGYVSLPVCFAAALRRIPMCVQEQNAHPGMANRVLAPLADRVFVAFRAAADALLRAKTHRIHGNPVRKSLRDITRQDARRKARFWFSMACGGGYKGQLREGEKNDVVLLILGGSLGASAINRAAARAIPELLATTRKPVGRVADRRGRTRARRRGGCREVCREVKRAMHRRRTRVQISETVRRAVHRRDGRGVRRERPGRGEGGRDHLR